MRGFLHRQRRLLLLLALLITWLSLFSVWSRWITAKPLDVSIALAPAGMIDRKIQIFVPEHYTLAFRFDRTSEPLKHLQIAVGGVASTSAGTPIPIRWSLARVSDGRIVASGEADTRGMHGWSTTFVERDVGGIRVPSGRYRFKAQVLQDIPGLAHVDTRLVMQLSPKAYCTWQLYLVWWGSIANVLLIGPLAILVLLVLLWRAARAYHSARTAS